MSVVQNMPLLCTALVHFYNLNPVPVLEKMLLFLLGVALPFL